MDNILSIYVVRAIVAVMTSPNKCVAHASASAVGSLAIHVNFCFIVLGYEITYFFRNHTLETVAKKLDRVSIGQ